MAGRVAGSEQFLDKAQDILGIAGMIPGVGAIADGVNAGIYGLRGKWGDAAFSAVSALPGIGDALGAGKAVKTAGGLFDDTARAMRQMPR